MTPPQEASSSGEEKAVLLEEQLDFSTLEKLKENTDVLVMLYSKTKEGNFYYNIVPEDELTIYDLVENKINKNDTLLIVLDTGGGNVYSAVKIMDTLRVYYKKIIIAVPQEAKSSGTMMCCGADELIMSSISELGPLDKPMVHPDNETASISALDIVRSIDGMIDTAIEKHNKLFKEIGKNHRGISSHEIMDISSDFISKLISPLLCKEDAKFYNQAKRLLAIGETYSIDLLDKFMLKYIGNDDLRKRISEMIAGRLVWRYPDHGFAIRRNELEDLFFKVKKSEDVPCWTNLYEEFKKSIGQSEKIIKFL